MNTTIGADLDGFEDFQETMPTISRWAREGTEYVRANAVWCIRCASRMIEVRRELHFEQAHDVAQALSLDDALRARTPELVAEDLVRDQLFLE